MRVLLLLPSLSSAGCLALVDPCVLEEEDNLLGGGNFDELTCWYDDDDHDWEVSGITITDDVASPGSGSPVYVANNETNSAPNSLVLQQGPWFSSLRKASLGLESGDTFRITFLAFANPAREIVVQMNTPTSPWASTGVLLTESWTEYEVIGTAGAGEADDAWFEMQFGGDAGLVHVDDVHLEQR